MYGGMLGVIPINKRQLEVEKAKLAAEEKQLKHMKAIYKKAADDITEKIEISNGKISVLLANWDELTDEQKSIYQSQIYQRDFQKSLQKQIDGFLKDLNSKQYKSVDEYLKDSYKTGYIGAMYDIAGQGIPIVTPIDQKQVVKAMTHDTKLSKRLYTRLGEDVDLLKKRVANNISRGIATADSYVNIARNIANGTKISINRTMTIARTEGNRIHVQAADHAQHKAKEIGADVVKQWCSALDGRTRPHHRQLDGQIREIDEPFEVAGMKVMYPMSFCIAAEDINCSWTLLQRARWALGEEELETLKERAAYFGLDKTKDFKDYKKKYLKASGLRAKIGDGKEIPLHEEPVLLKKISYEDKDNVLKELKSFEKNAIKEDIETACVITKDGEVFKCFGTADRVFPDSDLKDKLKGASVTHNHPISETEYSFSENDLRLFIKYELEILRGCDEKYTYEFTRVPNEVYEMRSIFELTEEDGQHENMMGKAKAVSIGYKRWKND